VITIYCECISNGEIAIQIYCESVLIKCHIHRKSVMQIYFLLFTFIRLKNVRWNVLMIPSNDLFRRVCQIRYIHVPTSCNSRIYGSHFVIQVLQVLYTRMSYFMWLEFPFFAATATQFCSLIPHRLFSNSFVLPILLHVYDTVSYIFFRLSSKVETQSHCLLLISLCLSTHCIPIYTYLYTHSRSSNCSW